MHLKIEIKGIWETGLAMRVLEQEGVERGSGEIWTDGEYFIRSQAGPQILGGACYVRGDEDGADDNISIFRFEDKAARAAWVNAIREGIRKINGDHPVEITTEIFE